MFGALYAADGASVDVLVAVAREFTPRLEVCSPREAVLDLTGVSRLFGDARAIGDELRREAADRGLRVRVAIAGTRTAARLLVHQYPGVTVVPCGTERAALAPLPIALLADIAEGGSGGGSGAGPDRAVPQPARATRRVGPGESPRPDQAPDLQTLRRWGLTTLGELAALDAREVAARLGQAGVLWQQRARGEDARPLVPAVPEERFEQALDLEWPIEGLEPLSFVLGRLMDPLSAHLERRDRGAAVLHVRLQLVTKVDGGARATHERSLELPTPIRDARTLRTLALLDLESHPPAAAIDRVTVAVDPTPARIVQFSLLTRPLPSSEQVSTLIARLDALMGHGRSGSPALVDSWQPGAFAMCPFVPSERGAANREGRANHRDTGTAMAADGPGRTCPGLPGDIAALPGGSHPAPAVTGQVHSSSGAARPSCPVAAAEAAIPAVALRRFRLPVPARVRVERGRPVRVLTDRAGLAGGAVDTCAGPWRTSGGWWAREEAIGAGRRSEASREREAGRTGKVPQSPHAWDRDEWDITLSDGATYRVFRERDTDAWFIEGVVD